MRFGALFEDKCTRNFRNMPCDSKVFVWDKCLIPSFFSLFYRMYNVLLSLPFPCFPAAGAEGWQMGGPPPPGGATVRPRNCETKKKTCCFGENAVGKLLFSVCFCRYYPADFPLFITRFHWCAHAFMR